MHVTQKYQSNITNGKIIKVSRVLTGRTRMHLWVYKTTIATVTAISFINYWLYKQNVDSTTGVSYSSLIMRSNLQVNFIFWTQFKSPSYQFQNRFQGYLKN